MVRRYQKGYCLYHENNCDEFLRSANFGRNAVDPKYLEMYIIEIYLILELKAPLNCISGNDVQAKSVKDFNESIEKLVGLCTSSSRKMARPERVQKHLAGKTDFITSWPKSLS